MTPKTGNKSPVTFVLPSFAGGGAERVSVELAGALAERGWPVRVVAVCGEGPLRDAVDPRVSVQVLGAARVSRGLPTLLRTLRAGGASVVFSTMAHLNLAVLSVRRLLPAGTRVIVREANTPSAILPRQRWPWLFGAGYRHLYPCADAVICPAQRIIDELNGQFRVPERCLTLLPNPVNEARLRAGRRRRTGAGLRLVAAGRLTAQKGFDRLLAELNRLPADTELEIFGDGPQRAALQASVDTQALGARVRLHGYSPDLADWLAGADALVMASRWEGMPNVALEALACGTRVYGLTSAGGLPELAREAPDDVSVFESLAALLDDLAGRLARGADDHGGVPAPSRLPAAHRIDAVATRLEQLLERFGA